MARIAIIPGDGIGPEVIDEAVRVLETLGASTPLELTWDTWDLGAERYLRTGETLTDGDFARLETDYDAILLGALGDPRVPSNEHIRDILLGLRFGLDLYVNLRPSRLLHPSLSPLRYGAERPMDVRIVRENTEGPYVGIGGRFKADTPDEVAIQEDVNTRKGVERIVRAAFAEAQARGRGSVTLVDKANAMPAVGALWRAAFADVAADFPDIRTSAMYVDAMAMDLVRNPERHEVLVTSNLFGDILSDLAAALTGGLGLAPSANLNPGVHALFEPVHGSAPDLAGSGTANPMAAILCTALLLEHLGEPDLAATVEGVVVDAIQEGVTTQDLGGTMKTAEVGAWIATRLSERIGE